MIAKHGGDIYSYNDSVIDFSANINPLGIPQSVKEAIIKSAEVINNYPDTQCRKLAEKIANKINVEFENIICSNGAADLIFDICLSLKPKKTLLVSPSFSEYEQAVDTVLSEKVYYSLKKENNFLYCGDIIDYLSDDIDMFFLCNPNNPTGVCIDAELMDKILKKCSENNIFVVIDECFNDFLENGDKFSCINKIKEYNNIFILKAFTKMYSMAGIRLGYGISDKKNIDKIKLSRQPWSVSTTSQMAGIAALSEDKFVEKTRKYINDERKFLYKGFERLNIKYYKSEVNFILFEADCDLDKRLIEKNILIRSCENYKGLKKGYYRIAVKTHKDNEILLNTLEDILAGD